MSEQRSELVPTVEIPQTLPILPLRDTVIFPNTVVPLLVGQKRSIQMLDDAMKTDRLIAAVCQRSKEQPATVPEDLYSVGTAVLIQQFLRVPDGSVRLIVQGIEKIRILEVLQTEPYFKGKVLRQEDQEEAGLEVEAAARSVRDLYRRLLTLVPEVPGEIAQVVELLETPGQLAYFVASNVPLDTATRQEILELDSVMQKLHRLIRALQRDIAVRELSAKILTQTKEQVDKAQRDYYLREQLKAIQRELGEQAEQPELHEMRERVERAGLPKEAREEAERELRRLERTPVASPEYGMIRTYLEWLVNLPWGRTSGQEIDTERAQKILDEDHYDLEKVKERIIEHLAVKRLRQERGVEQAGEQGREPILCFVGPPGVGKTSLGQSIARAMGRRFVRISLGGVHDEAEIRGHRRTYIGAMPGRIIQALRRAETADPVFMLDEVDKLGKGIHGDPAAALLEVLDPAQNAAFVDTYLNVPFDLSRVFFITTANTVDTIPPALLDRMDLLYLPGYTEEEKQFIAIRYLVPRQMAAHGLAPDELVIKPEAIQRIIRDYTREAGVRNLERILATVCRKAVRLITEKKTRAITVSAEDLEGYLGPPKYIGEVAERINRPGIATGLAWTPTGGELLFVEVAIMPGKKNQLILTGSLGDVMRESAEAALSYIRSRAELIGLSPSAFEDKDIHIHVPSGAIPKDGPSAGITIASALASALTGRLVRADVAMTGEITLRGKVLRIGGVKEKVLAAHRAGIKKVILPRANLPDLQEIPEPLRGEMQFITVDSVDEVLAQVLESTSS